MRLFAVAGSLRAQSYNRKLIAVAAELARAHGADVELGDFRAYCPPNYDGDVEAAQGLPAQALALVAAIEAADGLMIATPEYNRSVPGPLKNAFDWVSRLKPYRLQGKPVLLLGATSGKAAAANGIAALRNTLDFQGARLFADSFGLAHGAQAFAADGRLADAATRERLANLIGAFVDDIVAPAS